MGTVEGRGNARGCFIRPAVPAKTPHRSGLWGAMRRKNLALSELASETE